MNNCTIFLEVSHAGTDQEVYRIIGFVGDDRALQLSVRKDIITVDTSSCIPTKGAEIYITLLQGLSCQG